MRETTLKFSPVDADEIPSIIDEVWLSIIYFRPEFAEKVEDGISIQHSILASETTLNPLSPFENVEIKVSLHVQELIVFVRTSSTRARTYMFILAFGYSVFLWCAEVGLFAIFVMLLYFVGSSIFIKIHHQRLVSCVKHSVHSYLESRGRQERHPAQ